MISKPVPEELLMVAVGNLWRKRGARLAYEVPLYERFLDMVAVQESLVVAIELKVANWRRALQQAVVAQLAADEAYIAVCSRPAARVNRALLASTGIGLIVVDGLVAEIMVLAQRSRITMTQHRDAIAAWVKPTYLTPRSPGSSRPLPASSDRRIPRATRPGKQPRRDALSAIS